MAEIIATCLIEIIARACLAPLIDSLCDNCCAKKNQANIDKNKPKEETSFKVDMNTTSQPTYDTVNFPLN